MDLLNRLSVSLQHIWLTVSICISFGILKIFITSVTYWIYYAVYNFTWFSAFSQSFWGTLKIKCNIVKSFFLDSSVRRDFLRIVYSGPIIRGYRKIQEALKAIAKTRTEQLYWFIETADWQSIRRNNTAVPLLQLVGSTTDDEVDITQHSCIQYWQEKVVDLVANFSARVVYHDLGHGGESLWQKPVWLRCTVLIVFGQVHSLFDSEFLHKNFNSSVTQVKTH